MTKEEYKEYFFKIPPIYVENGLIDKKDIPHNDGTCGVLPCTEEGYIDEQFTTEEWRELCLEYRKRKKEEFDYDTYGSIRILE